MHAAKLDEKPKSPVEKLVQLELEMVRREMRRRRRKRKRRKGGELLTSPFSAKVSNPAEVALFAACLRLKNVASQPARVARVLRARLGAEQAKQTAQKSERAAGSGDVTHRFGRGAFQWLSCGERRPKWSLKRVGKWDEQGGRQLSAWLCPATVGVQMGAEVGRGARAERRRLENGETEGRKGETSVVGLHKMGKKWADKEEPNLCGLAAASRSKEGRAKAGKLGGAPGPVHQVAAGVLFVSAVICLAAALICASSAQGAQSGAQQLEAAADRAARAASEPLGAARRQRPPGRGGQPRETEQDEPYYLGKLWRRQKELRAGRCKQSERAPLECKCAACKCVQVCATWCNCVQVAVCKCVQVAVCKLQRASQCAADCVQLAHIAVHTVQVCVC